MVTDEHCDPGSINRAYKNHSFRKIDNKEINQGIITVNPSVVWPVFTLPTRGLKLYTLPT